MESSRHPASDLDLSQALRLGPSQPLLSLNIKYQDVLSSLFSPRPESLARNVTLWHVSLTYNTSTVKQIWFQFSLAGPLAFDGMSTFSISLRFRTAALCRNVRTRLRHQQRQLRVLDLLYLVILLTATLQYFFHFKSHHPTEPISSKLRAFERRDHTVQSLVNLLNE